MRNRKHHSVNFLLALTMIGALSTSAQSQQRSASQTESADQLRIAASNYYKIGWAEFGRGNIASAIEKYLESKRLFEEAHVTRDLIYVLADLGSLYIYSSDYKTSRVYSEQSLALADQVKGTSEPAGAWPDEYGVGTALSNLGNISRHEGDHDKAIEYFQKSLASYQSIDNGTGQFRVEILDNLADIGRTYLARGDSLRALNYLNQAMALARDSDREAGICNSIGILYTNQRDYSKAIEFFQRGLVVAVRMNDRFKQADLLLNVGVAYQFQQNYPSAMNSFERAMEVARQINYSELIIPIYEGRGAVLKAQFKYKEALESLDAGFELAKRTDNKTRVAELLWRKSEAQLAKGDVSLSIQNAMEAIKLAEQHSLRNVRYLALTNLGRAYRAAGQLDLAMQTFKKATSLIEEMRGEVAGLESERQLFFEDKVVPYHEIADMLLSANKDATNQQALLTAESVKARVLLDVFSTGRIELAKVMSDRENAEERKLNRRIVDLNNEIAQENGKQISDTSRLKNLGEQLRSARALYETFQASLYAAHPELRTHRRQTTAASLTEVSNLLTPTTAFLEYVVTDSKTYLLVLTKDQDSESPALRAYPIAISARDVANHTRAFRDMIATRSAFADDARQMYDLLLKPAEQQLKGKTSLCIVPDGILWDLPFQALQPRDGRYLLEDYSISYAPSLSVLRQMSLQKKTKGVLTSLLAFGNPTMPSEIASSMKATYRGETLGPLPEAEMEVSALKSIWGPSSSRVLIGTNARKNLFRSEASKYKIIHLATHGILDDTSPMYSRLIMARDENDPNDDGLLEAREIMQFDLNADLVILSACETARGRVGAGEGMVGMSWSFFVAGIPTMVASQWKVDSASTAKLMIDFHKRLKGSGATPAQTKATAFQQAALSLMKDPRYRHPYFWAGFVMIGKTS